MNFQNHKNLAQLGVRDEVMNFQTRREYIPVGSEKTSLFFKVWKFITSPLTSSFVGRQL